MISIYSFYGEFRIAYTHGWQSGFIGVIIFQRYFVPNPSVRESLSIVSVNINNCVPAELVISNKPNLAAGTTINKTWRINQLVQLLKKQ